ncbi:MAG: alpha-glucuronidase family glycosyl hydrolase [Sedimentisphaerales bacterium]
MKRRGVITIICVVGICLGGAAPASADDGYQLWLKYKKVGDPQKFEAYQKAISNYDVYGNSPTCEAIRGEMKRGLDGLLGENVPSAGTAHTGSGFHRPGGVVMVGTAENCEMVKKLNYTPCWKRPVKKVISSRRFHRVGWNYKMKSGRTLWDELCYKYYSGTDYVDEMIKTWESLEKEIDPEIYVSVMTKLEKQKVDAGIWRDTCLEYFGKFSKKPVTKPN